MTGTSFCFPESAYDQLYIQAKITNIFTPAAINPPITGIHPTVVATADPIIAKINTTRLCLA